MSLVMFRRWFVASFLGSLALGAGVAAAVEIKGEVSYAGGASVDVTTTSDLLPQVGDKGEIYIDLKKLNTTAVVSPAVVTAIRDTTIVLRVEDPKADVLPGHLARIFSEKPTKRGEIQPESPPAKPAPATPSQPTPPSTEPPLANFRKVTFDALTPGGPIANDSLAAQGLSILPGPGGAARVERASDAMTLPEGRSQLLMVVQTPRTSQFSLAFKQPLRRVSVTRIGVIKGGSLPKWRLTALTANGNVLASTGEDDWGFDAQPRTFSVEGDGIDRIKIDVDNRWGNGTYATYSCLPIAEIELTPQQNAPQSPPVEKPTPGAPSREAPVDDLPGGPVPGS